MTTELNHDLDSEYPLCPTCGKSAVGIFGPGEHKDFPVSVGRVYSCLSPTCDYWTEIPPAQLPIPTMVTTEPIYDWAQRLSDLTQAVHENDARAIASDILSHIAALVASAEQADGFQEALEQIVGWEEHSGEGCGCHVTSGPMVMVCNLHNPESIACTALASGGKGNK